MVDAGSAEVVANLTVVPDSAHSTRVTLRELADDLRFEASAYSIAARKAQDELRATGYILQPLYGAEGLAREAHNAFQFKRNFVGQQFGVPFMGSSDIIFLDYRPAKFLSKKNTLRLSSLMIQPWDVLLSCSGTVGNVALAPPAWSSYALSQHVMRIRFADEVTAGFVTCFLRSRWGRAQTVGSQYGSVINHIEPVHLQRVLIPELPRMLVFEIGTAFRDAALDRQEANRLMREAEHTFSSSIGLPDLRGVGAQRAAMVRLDELDGRFDANYHSPRARTALASLKGSGVPLTTVKEIVGDGAVRAVTKFRERTFARLGLPFVSSKEVFQVDPIGLNRLGRNAHLDDMPEIGLRRGMVAVTCSGTLGRVMQIPNYMHDWAGSQDFLRIVPANWKDSCYLTAWLGSTVGQAILDRYSCGSVIRHIDRWMLESMPVPLLALDDQDKIATLVGQATEFRERAWEAEQHALGILRAHLELAALSKTKD